MPLLSLRAPYVPAFARPRARALVQVGVTVDVGPKPTGDLTPIAKKSGTGVSTSQSDVDRYIALLEPLLQSLDNDVMANLVYDDPTVLDNIAKALDAAYAGSEGDRVRAEAATLRARAAGRSAAQVAKEQAFAKEWKTFFKRWPDDKSEKGCVWLSCIWDRIEADDLQYQAFHRDYQNLGYAATRSVPQHDEGSSSIPWGWIAFGIVLLGVGLFLTQLRAFVPSAR